MLFSQKLKFLIFFFIKKLQSPRKKKKENLPMSIFRQGNEKFDENQALDYKELTLYLISLVDQRYYILYICGVNIFLKFNLL